MLNVGDIDKLGDVWQAFWWCGCLAPSARFALWPLGPVPLVRAGGPLCSWAGKQCKGPRWVRARGPSFMASGPSPHHYPRAGIAVQGGKARASGAKVPTPPPTTTPIRAGAVFFRCGWGARFPVLRPPDWKKKQGAAPGVRRPCSRSPRPM